MTRNPDSKQVASAMRRVAALMVMLGAAYPGGEATAQSSFLLSSAACNGGNCFFGSPAFGVPPVGTPASSFIQHGFFSTDPDHPTTNFNTVVAAQASFGGVDKWSASSRAGGNFSSPGPQASGGVSGAADISVRDEFTLPSSPSWNGPGWLRLSYRITGAVAINYFASSQVSGHPMGFARSSITFQCGSARVGGGGSSRCGSPDFDPPLPGSINLFGRLNFDSSQTVDRVVRFDVAVHSDLLHAYGLKTSVNSQLTMSGVGAGGGVVGSAAADFSNTFSLVDAQLFDTGFNEVAQWSITSASGFDYANITAVPEPGTAALWMLGIGLMGWNSRRSTKSDS